MKILIKLLSVGFLILTVTNSTFAVEIRLPSTFQYVEQDAFKLGLLKLALQKAKVKYTITTSLTVHSQARVIAFLKKGSDRINLHWMGTSAQLEKDLLPIRFPIYRGLLGHRIFIIHKDDQGKFDDVKTLVDLQKYRGIQGIGWADIQIFHD